MGFDIPMNTTGCMGVSDLVGLNSGGSSQPNQGVSQAGVPQYNQGVFQAEVPQYNQGVSQVGVPQYNQGVSQSSTGVILKKGQKVNLIGQQGISLTNVRVGLGWDIINQACDLDASAFMLGADGKVIGDDWFVFYGQTNSPDNSIKHSGDSNGEGCGDDEVIDISLSTINPNIKKIVFVVTIDEALNKGLNFSMVQNAYVRVTNSITGEELIRFNLTEYYANVTSMVVGEIYYHNGQWKFNAVGDGVARDLAGLCEMYGVNVAG